MHFSATNAGCTLPRPRSQSIVVPENVNGTSLKGTPLPDESDYRITDVEASLGCSSVPYTNDDVVQNIDRCQRWFAIGRHGRTHIKNPEDIRSVARTDMHVLLRLYIRSLVSFSCSRRHNTHNRSPRVNLQSIQDR